MPVAAHRDSSSPPSWAYATIAASTPSTCLRKDSDSVHSQNSRQASSRSTSLMSSTLTAVAPVRRLERGDRARERLGRAAQLPVQGELAAPARQHDRVPALRLLGEARERPAQACGLGDERAPLELGAGARRAQ